MVSVTNDYKNALKARTREIDAYAWLSGTVGGSLVSYVLTSEDIIDINVEYPFTTGETATCGDVYSATFSMNVRSTNIPASFWTSASSIIVEPRVAVTVGTPPFPEYCTLGRFIVNKRTSTDNFQTYTIEGQDEASLLDVSYNGWVTNVIHTQITVVGQPLRYVYNASLVINDILTHCGLNIDPNLTIPISSIVIAVTDTQEERTARQWLGLIGGIWGANGMMTRDGYFTYKTYTLCPNAIDSIPLSMQWLGGLARDREDPQYLYRGYYHLDAEIGNPTGFTPTDFEGAVYLASDLFLKNTSTATDFANASDAFKTAMYDTSNYVVGGSLEYRGMPWLECGDVVKVQYDYNGSVYNNYFMISSHSLSVTGGLRGTMRCYTPLLQEVDNASASTGSYNESVSVGAAAAIDAKFPVGSVLVTSGNTNPSYSFGGSWTLIDKEFKSQSRTATVSRNTTNFSALSVTALYDGHSITFVGTMTSSVSISNTNLEVLTQTLTNNGASALPTSIPFIGYSDGAHAAVLMDIDTAGRVRTMDVVVRGTATSIASGASITWSVTCPCVYTAMEDGFCDKFYWQRTA